MRNTAFALLLCGLCPAIFAQVCTLPIPPGTIVVSANGTYSASTTAYWVCPGVSATFTGNSVAVYQEASSTVTLNGDDGGLFTPNGSSATINGDNNGALRGPTATVTDNGTGNTVFPCTPNVTYDYTAAPSSGCLSTGISSAPGLSDPAVQYDAAARSLRIILPGGGPVADIHIVDTQGREVYTGTAPADVMLDVSSWPAGAYWVRVVRDGRARTKGFVR